MTLKKINQKGQKGQAIFEYFILTAVVVAVILFFANSTYFRDNIKPSLETTFNNAVGEILR